MEKVIIVEVGQMNDDGKSIAYQLYERLTNGTYRCAKDLPEGVTNEPMYYRDARQRVAGMNTVPQYGAGKAFEDDEE